MDKILSGDRSNQVTQKEVNVKLVKHQLLNIDRV